MITDKLLEDRGYKVYDAFSLCADCLFQKRVKDDIGTKYFINIYKYNIRDVARYEVRVQCEKLEYTIEFTLFSFHKDITIEEIEKEIENIWNKLELTYYEED